MIQKHFIKKLFNHKCNNQSLFSTLNLARPNQHFLLINKAAQCNFKSTQTNLTNDKSALRLNVMFFGSDLFSMRILDNLNAFKQKNERLIDRIQVITSSTNTNTNIKTKNRVIDYCDRNGLTYFNWIELKKDKQKYERIVNGFHLGLVASFGHLIPSHLINLFPFGIVNVHPSLLPKWRGASPIIYQILFDEKTVGVSLMKILPKHFDIGPLLDQKSMPISQDLTSFQLLDVLCRLANPMITELFENFEERIDRAFVQNVRETATTYAHKITSQMFFINWNEQTMRDIHCQYRALHEIKNLKTILNKQVVKLMDFVSLDQAELNELGKKNELIKENGTIAYLRSRDLIAIKCKDGFVCFRNLILNKKLSAKDFYNGYLNNREPIRFESVANTIKDNIHKAKL